MGESHNEFLHVDLIIEKLVIVALVIVYFINVIQVKQLHNFEIPRQIMKVCGIPNRKDQEDATTTILLAEVGFQYFSNKK